MAPRVSHPARELETSYDVALSDKISDIKSAKEKVKVINIRSNTLTFSSVLVITL
jgi:hypothetical protein